MKAEFYRLPVEMEFRDSRFVRGSLMNYYFKDIPKGTLAKILRDLGLELEDLRKV